MNTSKFLILFCLTLLGFGCSEGQKKEESANNAFSDPELRKIYDAADQRNFDLLAPFAESETAAYRMAYARSMGSVQDTLALENLYDLMRDPVPYVRMFAAFAVGQYRDTTSLPALEKAIKKATIPEIKAEILEAIGKSANGNAMEYLIFHEPSSAIEESGKLWGIYHASLRDLLKEEHLRVIVAHLSSKEEDTRMAVLHTLSRQRDLDLSEYKDPITDFALSAENPEIRTAAIMAMRHLNGVDSLLIKIAANDSDPRARASAILAIADASTPEFQDLIAQSLEDGSVWVAMNAANRLGINMSNADLLSVEQLAITSPVPEVKAAIITAFLHSDSLKEKGKELWVRTRFKNDVEKAVFIKSLGRVESALDSLKNYSLLDSPLGTAAAEAIITGAEKYPSWKPEFYNQAKSAFEAGLVAQSYLYASALLNPVFMDTTKLSPNVLSSAVGKFTKEGEAETRNEMNRAIAKMSGEEYVQQEQSYSHKIDWELVQSIPTDAAAYLYIGDRKLELKLLVEDAPGSVSNFVNLAKSGFYDGTYFHRIVPVFVSQGGGPRGDGYGSTDYSIRSEFSPLKYGSGVAGLASAGKDTESCQFFFTHQPTPHLNGRYTIFGALTDGIAGQTDITTGTRIDSVRVEL